jgi:DNA-directed RNA polymerase alpha subunit
VRDEEWTVSGFVSVVIVSQDLPQEVHDAPEPIPMAWGEWYQTLSVRARKVLIRLGVNDWRTLASLTEKKIFSVKNAGFTTVHEFREKMQLVGMRLRLS